MQSERHVNAAATTARKHISERFDILCPFYKLSNVFVFANSTSQFVKHNIQVSKNDGLKYFLHNFWKTNGALPVRRKCVILKNR